MSRPILILACSFALSSAAQAQYDGCPSAVEHGKWQANNCIELGLPHCRTAEYLDALWAEAISTPYVQSQGGCVKENLIYEIYWDGAPPPPEPEYTSFEDPYAPAVTDPEYSPEFLDENYWPEEEEVYSERIMGGVR